jgi:hypothetical protein
MTARAWAKWVRECSRDTTSPAKLPSKPLAALTTQDIRALDAVTACYELYAHGDTSTRQISLAVVASLLITIQPHNRYLARELVAFVLDWTDREPVWNRVLICFAELQKSITELKNEQTTEHQN